MNGSMRVHNQHDEKIRTSEKLTVSPGGNG